MSPAVVSVEWELAVTTSVSSDALAESYFDDACIAATSDWMSPTSNCAPIWSRWTP